MRGCGRGGSIRRLGALARSSVGCFNIIPRTFFVRLVTVEFPSKPVPGESMSDPCLPQVLFRDRCYTMVACCSLFMFCLLLRLPEA